MYLPQLVRDGCKGRFFSSPDADFTLGMYRVSRPKSHILSRILFLGVGAILVSNVFVTYMLTNASIANYPGGKALSRFHRIFADETQGWWYLCKKDRVT